MRELRKEKQVLVVDTEDDNRVVSITSPKCAIVKCLILNDIPGGHRYKVRKI